MEKIYMETSIYKVKKVLDEKLEKLNIEEWLKLNVSDEFIFRRKLYSENSTDDLLEIKINQEAFKQTPFTSYTLSNYLSCFELQEYFDYVMTNYKPIEETVHFNDDQIFKYLGYRMGFVISKYQSNNSIAISIVCINDDNTDGELYGTLTVNLEEYGIENDTKEIAIHHDYMEYPQKEILDNFLEMYGLNYVKIEYGFAQSIMVRLRDFREIPIDPGLEYEDFE